MRMILNKGGFSGIAVLAALVAGASAGCGNTTVRTAGAGDGIVVTIRPLALIVAEIVGPETSIVTLLPAAASPHAYGFSPADARAAAGAMALIHVSEDLDGWAAGLSANRTIRVFEFIGDGARPPHESHDAAHASGHGMNPHFWTDPVMVRDCVPGLAEELGELYPGQRSRIETNAVRFLEELSRIDRELAREYENLAGPVVLHHPSWETFMDRYSIEVAGIIEPGHGREPSPRKVVMLGNSIREMETKAVITEPQLAPGAARAVADAGGVPLVELDAMASGYDSYAAWILGEGRKLKEALD